MVLFNRISSGLWACGALLTLTFIAFSSYGNAIDVNEAGVEGRLETTQAPLRGAVLILHGFNDDLDGVAGLQKQQAQALAELGIVSLRINFRGEGQRNAYRVTSTVTSRLEDTRAAYQYLNRTYPDLPKGVLGWSLGGMTAMLIAGQEPDWFQTMVLWSAAGSGAGLLVSTSDASYNNAARSAIETGEAQWQSWTKMTLTDKFLLSFVGVDVQDNLGRYPGELLSIRGTDDYLPALESQWLALLTNDRKMALSIGGADHIFNVLGPNASHAESVIEATSNWFDRSFSQ